SKRVEQFMKTNKEVQKKVNDILGEVQGQIGGLNVEKLPVFFWALPGSQAVTAFSSNLVNGHLINNTFVMPDPFIMSPYRWDMDGLDPFAEAADDVLIATPHVDHVEFLHVWYIWHEFMGEVHCSSSILRNPEGQDVAEWWNDMEIFDDQ
ncbi:MAG: hypothetical protein EA401_00105, partial [Planctomycetota bacterium]